jgi:hypothetical protein
VRVRHTDPCGAEGPTTASISISAAGQLLGTYNVVVEPSAEPAVLVLEAR